MPPTCDDEQLRDTGSADLIPQRVLVTGAAGLIGRVLCKSLAERYQLSQLDRAPGSEVVADIADATAIAPAFLNIDAVVHLAADGGVDAPWERLAPPNLTGVANVYEAARRAGVRRVVFASSNHVVGCYERDLPYSEVVAGHLIPGPGFPYLDSGVELRPDSHYGATKVYGEAVARQYWELHGVESVCLRIGTVTPSGDPEAVRHLATWLSHGDLAGLVQCALDAESVGCAVVYGVSNNRRRFWDVTAAEQQLGWRPADDAETFASRLLPTA